MLKGKNVTFEDLKELLSATAFYKIEMTDTYVALDDIHLKIHLKNKNEILDESYNLSISKCKDAFEDDMHHFHFSKFETHFTYKGELIQLIEVFKISGKESYSDEKIIDLYIPIQADKPINTPLPEEDEFRKVIFKTFNNQQALDILKESVFRLSIV